VAYWHEVVGRWPLVTQSTPSRRDNHAYKEQVNAPELLKVFLSRLAWTLSANRHLDSAAEVERQRGKTGSRIIVLAGQIFDC
jgi:hypothetical protein